MHADRPSSTATLIAAATVFLARDARFASLVPPGAAEVCARCLPPLFHRLATERGLRRLAWYAERATVPGLMLHFMLRKRWIEEAVRSALQRGAVQVVVIGAGFDTLAARLALQFPRVRFIEIDHPATQAVKRAAVQRDNLEYIAADLARTALSDALRGSSYSADRASVFIAEGLLMYLTTAQMLALFAAIGELQRMGGDVVFTVMEPARGGRIAFHNATMLERALLSLWKEPFSSALAREALPGFLGPLGLTLRAHADADELRRRYLQPAHAGARLARGELAVHATRRA